MAAATALTHRVLSRHSPDLYSQLQRIPVQFGPYITNRKDILQRVQRVACYSLEILVIVFFYSPKLTHLVARCFFFTLVTTAITPQRARENQYLLTKRITDTQATRRLTFRNKIQKQWIFRCLRVQTIAFFLFGYPLLALCFAFPYFWILHGLSTQDQILHEFSLDQEIYGLFEKFLGRKIYNANGKSVIFDEEKITSPDTEFVSSRNYLRLAFIAFLESEKACRFEDLIQRIPADKQQIKENTLTGIAIDHHPWLISRQKMEDMGIDPEKMFLDLKQTWNAPYWLEGGERRPVARQEIPLVHSCIKRGYNPKLPPNNMDKAPFPPHIHMAVQECKKKIDGIVYLFRDQHILSSVNKELNEKKRRERTFSYRLEDKITSFFYSLRKRHTLTSLQGVPS